MEKLKVSTIIFLLVVGVLGAVAVGKAVSVLLQEGLYAEEIEGDLDSAIKIYEEIIAEPKGDERTTAEAMYRLGMCHIKKQDERQAVAVFEKLIAEFPEQRTIIERVQPLLEQMSNPDPAALMPPNTKIYLEFGSPGKQIETIVNMLKGTPFENPLAVLGGQAGQQATGERTPGDIMAALLNPSMMAEFKKIRGMAIGVTGIQNNNPPVVVVLFPGESDALRGIFLAALGVAGKPAEAIGGLQTLQIGSNAGAAYDDNVIIMAQPLEQLTWCAKQYKGIISEPTFVSENKVFAKLSRKMREENAMTMWFDGAATFAAISEQMAEGGQMAQFHLADGIVDFEKLKEIVAYFSIRENSITVEANTGFKDGHNCLAYDLIRTPNLRREGFKAVPAGAVAVASFALSEAEDGRAEAAQKAVKKLTGLDIGREIFANIEQVNLFALPPGSDSAGQDLGAISCFGLAITSQNPERTRQLLTELLTVADLVVNTSMGGESRPEGNPAGGRYKVAVVRGQGVYCYMDQVDNTTILALSPWVLEASLAALKSGRTAFASGPLQETLSQLPPETSKLVLVNAGGALRIADSHIKWEYENPENPIHSLLGELARAFDNTSVQLRTEERLNSFNMWQSVDNIPALGPVFPLLMQAAQIDMEAKAKATGPEPGVGTAVGAETKVELRWEPGVKATKHNVYYGKSRDALSLMAEVKSPIFTEVPALKEDTTYYWRVDEVWADGTLIGGDVWSFGTGKLVGWWRFDEGGGDIAKDSSKNAYDGALNNMDEGSRVKGVTGGALKFDGMNDYVSIPALNLNSNTVTMTAWIKQDGTQSESFTGIVYCRDGSTMAGISFGGTDNFEINNELTYNWNETYSAWNWDSGLVVPDNEWVFVSLVVEPSKATMYLGEKGTLSSATNSISHDMEEFDGVTRIGHDAHADGRFFRGTIDDVRIYNYALSEEEIETVYSEGKER